MTRCAWAVVAIVSVACGKDGGAAGAPGAPSGPRAGSTSAATAPPHAAAPPAIQPTCEPLPFAASTPVPEASGAAWLEIDGKPELVVVSDSGNHGAYGIVDPETGATIETGTLPLSSEAGDDIEGVAARGGELYGVTSSGWIRVWRRSSGGASAGVRHGGFELVGKPYPLGPIDLPDAKHDDRALEGDGMVCNGAALNCGRNYEGLCLASKPHGGACVGFVASKADGHLYCLTDEAGKLAVHHDRSIAVARAQALSDCAFSDDDTLWVGNNLFDLGEVSRVVHWDDPAHATVERVAALAIGFPEGIAVRGDVVYRMSDMGGAPSLMARYRCRQ